MSGTLVLVRGVSGSGKSTLAAAIAGPNRHWEADMFFRRRVDEDGDEYFDMPYTFDASRLKEAHQWCLSQADCWMDHTSSTVVISNTFTQVWEMQPYFDLAKEKGWDVSVIKVVGNHGNIHGVPEETVQSMRDRWEDCAGEITLETCGLSR